MVEENIYLQMVEIMQPKNAIKINYEGGLGIETKSKSAGPHMHLWLTAGPVGGFCSWASLYGYNFNQYWLNRTLCLTELNGDIQIMTFSIFNHFYNFPYFRVFEPKIILAILKCFSALNFPKWRVMGLKTPKCSSFRANACYCQV